MSKKYITDFPQLLEEWNYSKNKDLSPSEVFSSSQKKVWWVCKKGHEYECSPGNKTQMHVGCPICSSRRLLKRYNDLETKYPKTNNPTETKYENTNETAVDFNKGINPARESVFLNLVEK